MKKPNTPFNFYLPAWVAQELFNIHEGMADEPELTRQIWRTEKARRSFRRAMRIYAKQLEAEYRRNPGVEI